MATDSRSRGRIPKYLFGQEYSVETKGRLQEHFKIKEKLGTGTYATVRRGVRREDGQPVAIKIIKKKDLDALECELVRREIDIGKRIEHQNVVKLYDLFESKHHVYLVMELCTGGELFDRVIENGNFSEAIAANVLRQISEALLYMHDRNIIHRDLKPENLLYAHRGASSPIKVTDFGLAKMIRTPDETMITSCGTLYYVAPEILQGREYTKAVDLWSLGVILYVLLSGSLPFYSDDESETQELIKVGRLQFTGPIWDSIGDSAKGLVTQLLQRDPTLRPDVNGVLAHEWIQKEGMSDTPLFGKPWLHRLSAFNMHRKTVSAPVRSGVERDFERSPPSDREDEDDGKEE